MVKLENERLTQRGIKSIHLKQIYLNALRNGTTSRLQLKEELHLSTPSICALVDELIDRKLLIETGTTENSGRGRPGAILQASSGPYVIPVISLCEGGFQASLFDICGRLIEQKYLPVDIRQATKEDGFCCIDDRKWVEPILAWLKNGISASCHPLVLLMSLCGNFHDSYFMSSVLHIKISDAFLPFLKERSGLDVIFGNTASFYAYGEKKHQKDGSDFVFIVVENGVGAGIIRDGEIFGDGPVRAGEIGHISIDYLGRPCICGNRGCLEQYISIPAITADAGLPFEEVCAAYRSGVPSVTELIDEKAYQLAIGINNVLCMQPTERIIIGGKIKALGPDFLVCLRRKVSMVGARNRMGRITLEYAAAEETGEAYGAVWNYIDHILNIDDLVVQ